MSSPLAPITWPVLHLRLSQLETLDCSPIDWVSWLKQKIICVPGNADGKGLVPRLNSGFILAVRPSTERNSQSNTSLSRILFAARSTSITANTSNGESGEVMRNETLRKLLGWFHFSTSGRRTPALNTDVWVTTRRVFRTKGANLASIWIWVMST